jgi:hypothetical protein
MQYYTEQVMRGLGAQLPDGLSTFLAKASMQSAPYTAYQNWLAKGKQPSPEATRAALLTLRNSNPPILKHEEFLKLLKAAHAQISGK